MRTSFARRFAILVTTVVLSSSQAIAQSPPPVRLAGLIHDYTQPLDTSGPWLIVGEWSLTVNQASGKVGFVASLSMVRSENTSREAHTHHISLTEGGSGRARQWLPHYR